MSPRANFSILLVLLGSILAFLPLRATRSLGGQPHKLLSETIADSTSFTVDQVARFIADEEPMLRLIDLRSPEEYMKSALPGSVNIPYGELLDRDPSTFLGSGGFINIFYSNGDIIPGYAVVLASGLGYKNCYSMKGGVNEWFRTVMHSSFTGDKITARENAVFEARTKAGRLFTELNSLPDSLRIKYLNSKKFNAKKLDGGCE
jgi:rhodanese-related sulfurtransferase